MVAKEEVNPNKTARIAGLLYLIMAPFAFFGIMYVPSTLIVTGDVATTVNNIMASESLFRLSIVSTVICSIIFILLVLFLYKLLKSVNKNHAVLMVVFVLVSVPITLLNELNHFAALLLLSGVDYLTVFQAEQLHVRAMLYLDLHQYGIVIAQIFWGLWLFPLGYLVFKSGFLPRILGILLMIGCFGYLIDVVTIVLFPNFDATISQFTFIGELLLPLWLLIKGVNIVQWEKCALEST